MCILAPHADERVKDVRIRNEMLSVDLMDGRIISVPLAWYPRLLKATKEQFQTGKLPAEAMGFTGLNWMRT